jgi:hypothetical protein
MFGGPRSVASSLSAVVVAAAVSAANECDILPAMASREQKEQKFGRWEELPNGGRHYFRDFLGRAGGRARYVKEVDAAEKTIRFAQEIYDQAGRLVALHEKFPVDLGHKQL